MLNLKRAIQVSRLVLDMNVTMLDLLLLVLLFITPCPTRMAMIREKSNPIPPRHPSDLVGARLQSSSQFYGIEPGGTLVSTHCDSEIQSHQPTTETVEMG